MVVAFRCWLLLLLLCGSRSEFEGKRTVDVVLSYFSELDECVLNTTQAIREELASFTVRLFVYSKNPSRKPTFVTHTLPNEGREGATYLHHITSSFHDLADHVLFMQACPNPRFRWIPAPLEAAAVGNSDLRSSLALFRAKHASISVMNFGASEAGTCDGTSAYHMPRLRELWGMTHHDAFCPSGYFMSFMGGQFLVSKLRSKRLMRDVRLS
jgi:hypothetical protein